MGTLKEDINRAVISIHRELKKEWISLKEIYIQVEKIRKKPNANKGASIRVSLESHCIQSEAYSGNQMYILKEKRSDLYKSIYYDNIKRISELNIGEIFSRNQIMDLFKISGQSGIMKSNSLDLLVLISMKENDIYNDSGIINGRILYTGEGQIGDQMLIKNNKSLYNSKEENLPVYLFTKDKKRKYIFEGRVFLYDIPYQTEEIDIEKNNRKVWKFPLQVIYNEEYENYETSKNFKNIVDEVKLIDNKVEIDVSNDELVFVDEPLIIRKYRENQERRKVIRKNKPDYIAEEIIKNKQGIINENVIYKNELGLLIKEKAFEQVKKMKDFFENKKENEGYDILSYELNQKGEYIEKYIEVKSTKGDESTPIDITDNEIYFAKNHIDQYYIYRIIQSDSKNRYIKVVKGKDLFNNYDFIPTSYKIYSK